jgi:hypothetical protein
MNYTLFYQLFAKQTAPGQRHPSKGVLSQGDVGQVLFHLWEEKKVSW